jgi:hypothetical protein
LADVQGFRRLGKPALMHDFDKAAQLFEFHMPDSVLEWL